MSSPAPLHPASPVIVPVSEQRRRLARTRFWLALAVAIVVTLPFYPPAWHGALRTWLGWQAHRYGYNLSIASMEGGVFDTTRLYDVRWRQQSPRPPDTGTGTDLTVARADLTLAWTVPWFQRPAPSWVHEIVLDGVHGEWDLGKQGHPAPAAVVATVRGNDADSLAPAAIQGGGIARVLAGLMPSFGGHSARLVPETFLVRADDLRVRRGRYQINAMGMRLSGSRDDAGQFLARAVKITGPNFENTLLAPHCQTYWKGSRLTVTQLALGPDVMLASATLDGSHLDRRQIDWEGRLTALGGEARGQGAVKFARDHLVLEVAASLQGAAVRPLARLFGIDGPADGLIDRGVFTFHGDPERWADAQMSLAAHSTDFRWGKRRWEDLELQAVVVNRRVQIHRLDLRQSRNRVSLTGECPLPPAATTAHTAADALRQWREGGFSAQIDARLDDLRSLADLFAPHAPELDGRVSVNGTLTAPPGVHQTINGYLNVEGTRLTLLGAPLDFLRSTLLFKDGNLRVADLQATHDTDYFTGTGSMRLDGPPRYEGELRAEVKRLAAYTPALADLPLMDDLARVNGLNALLRWDDSMLRFEQFQGRFDDAPFTVGGTMDLHDPMHPALDLSLDGENVILRGTASAGDAVRADCALTMRGQIGNLPTLGGDVRLLSANPGITLELWPCSKAAGGESGNISPYRPFPSLDDWLPAGWEAWNLDLDITSADRSGSASRNSDGISAPDSSPVHVTPIPTAAILVTREVTPNLHLRKNGAASAPEIRGRIDLHDVYLLSGDTGDLGFVSGTLYFPSEPDQPPTVSIVRTGVSPISAKSDVFRYYGPATRLRKYPLAGAVPRPLRLDIRADESVTPHAVGLELPLAGSEIPWAELLALPDLLPTVTEYELILR